MAHERGTSEEGQREEGVSLAHDSWLDAGEEGHSPLVRHDARECVYGPLVSHTVHVLS